MKKNLSRWIIAALVIAVVVLFSRVATLSKQIAHLQINVNNSISNLENEIHSIYANVDEQLKAKASLLTGVDFSFGQMNTDTHQLPLKLTVTPKALTDDMEVSVSLEDASYPLTRSGASFSGTIPVGLFYEYNTIPLLTIRSAGTVQTQQLTEVDISYLGYNYLPTLISSYSGKATHTNLGGLSLNGKLSVDYSIGHKLSPVTFGELTLLAEVNGKEIAREALGSPLTPEEGHYEMPLEKSYALTENDALVLYVLAEDSLGYIHKVPFYSWEKTEQGYPMTALETVEQIYDKDGNLLSKE